MSHTRPPRKQRRRDLRVPLRVKVDGQERAIEDRYAINLSTDGVCLQSPCPEKSGDRIRLRFRLSPYEAAIEVEADVVWVTREDDFVPGMHYYEVGLRFQGLDAAKRAQLARFVENSANYWLEEPEPAAAMASSAPTHPSSIT